MFSSWQGYNQSLLRIGGCTPREHFPSQYTVKQIYQIIERCQDTAHFKEFRSTSDRLVTHQGNQSAIDSMKMCDTTGNFT